MTADIGRRTGPNPGRFAVGGEWCPMMHSDQIPLTDTTVRRLVAAQFPVWRDEPVRPVNASGTVNAIYRIGSGLAARFPLQAADPATVSARLRAEASAMTELAGSASFPAPRPVAIGDPGEGYPLPWSVQTWLPGVVATPTGLAESVAFAQDVATLIGELRRADTRCRRFTGNGRGGLLSDHDQWMQLCFDKSKGLLDVERLRSLWARLRKVPRRESDVMNHGDLIPSNLLVDGERLVGVLDGGGFAPADPALDLVAAWHLFDRDARDVLRAELACSDEEWQRGAAWAFEQAMGLVWYYQHTNPAMNGLGRSTLERLLDAAEV